MSQIRQYIGARYVTKIYENSLDPSSADWESGVYYEPLTLVTYNNASYLSKKDVPSSIGNPASNPSYWVQTGAYNGQIAMLQAQIDQINADIRREYVVPEDYGAVGDGVTDDSTAISDAISDANGRMVLFGAKTYAIGAHIVLPSNITLIGNNTVILNLNSGTLENMIEASNKSNIKIIGIEFNNDAPVQTVYTNTLMWSDGVIKLTNCNHVTIDGVKVHGIRFHQSGILLQGEHNEVKNSEVYSGSGNRNNYGILLGCAHFPAQAGDGGAKYTSVHGCYVHDISIGSTPSESGYGIYFMGCEDCDCYDNIVIDCNWVCINTQKEQGLSVGRNIKIHDNFTSIDSSDVSPRADYLGPFNIYVESTENCEVYNNTMVCGNCTSVNYVPLCISDSNCDHALVADNRFILGSTNKIRYLLSFGCEVDYHDNICDFVVPKGILIYNDPEIKLTMSNCNMEVSENIIDINKGEQSSVDGYITIDNCHLKSTTGHLINLPPESTIDVKIVDSKCEGGASELIQDYGHGSMIIDGNVIKSTGAGCYYGRYGSGDKKITNNQFICTDNAIHFLASDTSFGDITVRNNNIKGGSCLRFIGCANTGIYANGNVIDASSTPINITASVSFPVVVVSDNVIKATTGVYVNTPGNITRGFVCNNVGAGIASIGVTGAANLLVENNNCIA